MIDCFDLRPWAESNHYRWRYEEGYRLHSDDDEWFVEVVCKYGLIYPKGDDTLLAHVTRGMKRHIVNLSYTKHHQFDGGAEVFSFPADHLDEIAAILKPRKRRTLDSNRARLISGLQNVHAQKTEDHL